MSIHALILLVHVTFVGILETFRNNAKQYVAPLVIMHSVLGKILEDVQLLLTLVTALRWVLNEWNARRYVHQQLLITQVGQTCRLVQQLQDFRVVVQLKIVN
jgi:hydrogenase maturation factor